MSRLEVRVRVTRLLLWSEVWVAARGRLRRVAEDTRAHNRGPRDPLQQNHRIANKTRVLEQMQLILQTWKLRPERGAMDCPRPQRPCGWRQSWTPDLNSRPPGRGCLPRPGWLALGNPPTGR